MQELIFDKTVLESKWLLVLSRIILMLNAVPNIPSSLGYTKNAQAVEPYRGVIPVGSFHGKHITTRPKRTKRWSAHRYPVASIGLMCVRS